MKKIRLFFYTIILLLGPVHVFSQSDTSKAIQLFPFIDNNPKFPGGQDSLNKYIDNNIKYPTGWPKDSIIGKVYIRFIVDKNGIIKSPKILRGLDPVLDSIALQIFVKMPKWIPGTSGENKPIDVEMVCPVRFGYIENKR